MTRSSGNRSRHPARAMLVLPLVLLFGGCFDVQAPSVYRCNAKEPECPPGLTCSAGLCVGQASKDAATDVSTDASRDAGSDVVVEAGGDAVVEAGGDAGTDGGTETAPDAASDATPDV